jgi:aminoglycoside phosphotransferase (APT) family kinase protein
MEYVRARGFPVPAVNEVSDDGLNLVMQRINRLNMVDTLTKRPWAVRQYGRLLADLHRALHRLVSPAWLPPAAIGEGERIIHLDLHPLNVIMSPAGPVVIDWTNARRGDPAVDVALTWVLLESGSVTTSRGLAPVLGRARRLLTDSFLSSVHLDDARLSLRSVVEGKVQDPNMSAEEQAAMWRLVDARGS